MGLKIIQNAINDRDEIIAVSPIVDLTQAYGYSRKVYYQTVFQKDLANVRDIDVITSRVVYATHIYVAILFDQHGNIILQIRNTEKAHNPGKLDKTVGGHILARDFHDPLWTGTQELMQELFIPIISAEPDDFEYRLGIMKNGLTACAFATRIDEPKLWWFKKVVGEDTFLAPQILHLNFGLYFGRISAADNEVGGILFMPTAIESIEGMFGLKITDDLVQLFEAYPEKIKYFSDLGKSIGAV